MENPLVSVVIPTYNHSNYLMEAIESALKSSYRRIEVIVVNDGSTDSTKEVLNSILHINNLHIYHLSNSGAAQAINFGIEKARGDVIAILNDDDTYAVNHVENGIRRLLQNSSNLDISSASIFGDGPTFERLKGFSERKRFEIEKHGPINSLFKFNWALSTSSFIFHKSLFDSGLKFKNLVLCHDLDFIFAAALRQKATISLSFDESWNYRCHSQNTVNSIKETRGHHELAYCAVQYMLDYKDFWMNENFPYSLIGYGIPQNIVDAYLNYIKTHPETDFNAAARNLGFSSFLRL